MLLFYEHINLFGLAVLLWRNASRDSLTKNVYVVSFLSALFIGMVEAKDIILIYYHVSIRSRYITNYRGAFWPN